MPRALVNVPSLARRGQIIEIKVLMSHPMESGYRVGFNGRVIPRDIIQLFTCAYNGVEVFRAQFSPAVAANPFSRVSHDRHRVRHARLSLDRRQRLRRDRTGDDHRRMTRFRALGLVVILSAPTLAVLWAADIPREDRKSGYETMGPQARAMEDDDFANPATLWALDGETIWNRRDGHGAKILRGLPWRCGECEHARHRCALPCPSGPTAGSIGSRRPASPSVPDAERQGAAGVSAREPRQSSRSAAFVAKQSRGAAAPTSPRMRRRESVDRGRPKACSPSPAGTARFVLRAVPRRQLGPLARRGADPARPSDRVSALSARMADPRLPATPASQLPLGHAGGGLSLR